MIYRAPQKKRENEQAVQGKLYLYFFPFQTNKYVISNELFFWERCSIIQSHVTAMVCAYKLNNAR